MIQQGSIHQRLHDTAGRVDARSDRLQQGRGIYTAGEDSDLVVFVPLPTCIVPVFKEKQVTHTYTRQKQGHRQTGTSG